jgi:REP element-mobilizing transposase RayT
LARGPRLDAPGVVHHVWARAVDGRLIFLDPRECRDLLERLAELAAETGALFFAWAIMSNHLHLVVRTGPVPLSVLMHRLHTGFAARFNLLFGRQGHVFQSRFGSRVIADTADLMGVIRYVHRNPVTAGIVPNLGALETYLWCGHGALLGRRPPLPFEAVSETLALFGEVEDVARERLRAWMELSDEVEASARVGHTEDLARIIREVCSTLGVGEGDLRAGRRFAPVSRARAVVCERAVRELGMRPRDLARALGLSEAAVSLALRRVSKVRGLTPF